MIVLDASALLAFVLDELGAETVEVAMATDELAVSTVNLAEVVTKLVQATPELAGTLTPLWRPPGLYRVEPFVEADVATVAKLWPVTKGAGLSLGDRACLALGRRLDAPVLTADRIWARLDANKIGTEVRLIR